MSEKLPQIKKDEVDFFFDVLDDDRSGTISKSEFLIFRTYCSMAVKIWTCYLA